MEQQGFYKAGLYLRLSQDDGQAGDSSSIQNQKAMLEKHCNEQGFNIIDVYIDDGYSGVNFNRPDFQRLLNDIDDKRINLVLTKDLSRLGRDYIQTGYYTEIFFPNNGIRYIALNDNVDTIRQDNDIAPFKNILNDMYARDLSRKIKSAKRQQALKGDFMSGQTPYGYKHDPTDKHKLVIDEEPAEIIKEIFRLAMTGLGVIHITKQLRERRIMSPGYYKAKQGDTRFYRWVLYKPEHQWGVTTVQKIVRDRVYVGDMVNRKYETKNYKTKKRTPVPRDQRIVVENTHKAIIDRYTFNRVQDLIDCRHRVKKHDHENLFKRILFCDECGYRLHMAVDGNRVYYNCTNPWTKPERCRRSHYINHKNLYNIVFSRLKDLVKTVNNDDFIAELSKNVESADKKEKVLADKSRIETRLRVLDRMLQKLYEDFICEQLEVNNYQKLLMKYQAEQKTLGEQLKTVEAELSKERDQMEGLNKLKETVNRFFNFEKLTSEMLHQLIDRIEIGHAELIDGEKRQNVNIVYRFVG